MTSEERLKEYERVYVIGDIHGRSDLLDAITEGIRRDLCRGPFVRSLTVTLGDYVDRGPDTRGVLDRLVRNQFPTDYIGLKGNHEQLMETFMTEPSVMRHWGHLGGLATLRSYGALRDGLAIGRDAEQLAKALQAELPIEHSQFLLSLRTSLTIGNYFLCHAGVRPGIRLAEQADADLLWIRDEFLRSNEDFGKIIVHGHTPTDKPEIVRNRINIDTGAFLTGCLTCLVLQLDDGTLRFISTG